MKIRLRNRAEIQGLKNILAKRTDRRKPFDEQVIKKIPISDKEKLLKRLMIGNIKEEDVNILAQFFVDGIIDENDIHKINDKKLRNDIADKAYEIVSARNLDKSKEQLNEVDLVGKQARVKKMLVGKVDQSQLDSIIKIVFDADQTPEKKYVEWVARQLANKAIELPRDTQRLQKALNTFYKEKQRFTKQDINQYKSFADLEKEFAGVEQEKFALAKKEEYIRKAIADTNFRLTKDEHIVKQKVEQIFEIDPTKEKKYLEWITKGFIKGEIVLPEDLERTKKELKHYHENKNSYDYQDIKYFTPETLGVNYAEIIKDPNFGKFEIKEFNNAELVYDDGTWRAVYIHGDPKTDKDYGTQGMRDKDNDVISALMFYSKGTRWCTANPSNANYYLSQGHLVLFAKRAKKIALMNLGSSSLQNPANGDLQHSNPDQYKEVVNIIGQIYDTGEEKK